MLIAHQPLGRSRECGSTSAPIDLDQIARYMRAQTHILQQKAQAPLSDVHRALNTLLSRTERNQVLHQYQTHPSVGIADVRDTMLKNKMIRFQNQRSYPKPPIVEHSTKGDRIKKVLVTAMGGLAACAPATPALQANNLRPPSTFEPKAWYANAPATPTAIPGLGMAKSEKSIPPGQYVMFMGTTSAMSMQQWAALPGIQVVAEGGTVAFLVPATMIASLVYAQTSAGVMNRLIQGDDQSIFYDPTDGTYHINGQIFHSRDVTIQPQANADADTQTGVNTKANTNANTTSPGNSPRQPSKLPTPIKDSLRYDSKGLPSGDAYFSGSERIFNVRIYKVDSGKIFVEIYTEAGRTEYMPLNQFNDEYPALARALSNTITGIISTK